MAHLRGEIGQGAEPVPSWPGRKAHRLRQTVREYLVDVSGATSWAEFIEAFNQGFVRQVGGEWDGHLDAFNDYLWWPDEHPYRLVVCGWHLCASAVNQHETWDHRPVLEVIAEILHENPQTEVALV